MVHVNYLAVLISAVASMIIGSIWYGPLFGKMYMQIMGMDKLSPEEQTAMKKSMGVSYFLQFIASLRELSGGKPVGFKLCVGKRHEFLAICKAMVKTGIRPDFIARNVAVCACSGSTLKISGRMSL